MAACSGLIVAVVESETFCGTTAEAMGLFARNALNGASVSVSVHVVDWSGGFSSFLGVEKLRYGS